MATNETDGDGNEIPNDDGGANTTRLAGMVNAFEARVIGDQLRGIAYLSKKLALMIREKNVPTPFDPAEIEGVSNLCYSRAGDLRGHGDDGSNGG